jgi:hypothetical protein
MTPGDQAQAQLTRARIGVANHDRARAVTAVQLGMDLPATHDRMWETVSIGAGRSAEIRLTERDWAATVPEADAHRLVVEITGVRFANDESWPGKDTVAFPASKVKRAQLSTTPAPRAREEAEEDDAEERREAIIQVSQEFPDEASTPARFRNPPGADVVILEARTPVITQDWGEAHAAALLPAVRLENRTGREVVSVLLRFKAEPGSHSVSGYDVKIPPHSNVVVRRAQYGIWGKPAAMTVQLLGARFADGSVWGTMDSRIDSRDPWVFPLEDAKSR